MTKTAAGLFPVLAPAFVFFAAGLFSSGCGSRAERSVVVYTSTDQVEAAIVLDGFTRKTGIKVLPVYDAEAQKTTGLALRLAAEKDRPQADVFWNNELSRTVVLFGQGVLAPYRSPSAGDIPARWKDADDRWASFSWRARVIVYNTQLVKEADAPRTLADLYDAKWRGKVAVARPLFGTTACHVAALGSAWGNGKALDYFRRLADNDVRVYEGNSVVRDVVANGEALVGLTDTDDVLVGKGRGMSVDMIFPDQGDSGLGTLVIPNSVALVAGAPHEAEAKMLIDYLLSREVEEAFADPAGGRFGVRAGGDGSSGGSAVPEVRAMEVDWAHVSRETAAFSEKVAEVLD